MLILLHLDFLYEFTLGLYLVESCHVGFMWWEKKEKKNKPTPPALGSPYGMIEVMVTQLLSLNWALVTTGLGQVWTYIFTATYTCICWISQGAWCDIYAGWQYGCRTLQVELPPNFCSVSCCIAHITERLYTCLETNECSRHLKQPLVRRPLVNKDTDPSSLALRQTPCVHNHCIFWKSSLEDNHGEDAFSFALHCCPQNTLVFNFPHHWSQL